MAAPAHPENTELAELQERDLELGSLFMVNEILTRTGLLPDDRFEAICDAVRQGFREPELVRCRIDFPLNTLQPHPGQSLTSAILEVPFTLTNGASGLISVIPNGESGADTVALDVPKQKFIETVARRLKNFLDLQQLQSGKTSAGLQADNPQVTTSDTVPPERDWSVIFRMLEHSDLELLNHISLKMMIYLCLQGVGEAEELYARNWAYQGPVHGREKPAAEGHDEPVSLNILHFSAQVFDIASRHLSDQVIQQHLERWIQEDSSTAFMTTLINPSQTHYDVIMALHFCRQMFQQECVLPESVQKGMKVHLITRFLSNQLEFIRTAKDFIELQDIFELIPRLIYRRNSTGKLGGKGAGLFLGECILRHSRTEHPSLEAIGFTRSWYVTTDGLPTLLHENRLEEFSEQKYKSIVQIKREYPLIVRMLKSARYPTEIIRGFSMLLDESADKPLIVRSSSLLEGYFADSFAEQYKSQIVVNRGSREERLRGLLNAVAEVYSSIFWIKPIEYRTKRGLLDFNEEMGLLIQELVGVRIGSYFLPLLSGRINADRKSSAQSTPADVRIDIVFGIGSRISSKSSDYYCFHLRQESNTTTWELDAQHCQQDLIDVVNESDQSLESIYFKDFREKFGTDLRNGFHEMLNPEIHDVLETFDRPVEFLTGLLNTEHCKRQLLDLARVLSKAVRGTIEVQFACNEKGFHLI